MQIQKKDGDRNSPMCPHYNDTPIYERWVFRHPNKDFTADCEKGFYCCTECKNGVGTRLLIEFIKYQSEQEMNVLICQQGEEGEHNFPSFAQHAVLGVDPSSN